MDKVTAWCPDIPSSNPALFMKLLFLSSKNCKCNIYFVYENLKRGRAIGDMETSAYRNTATCFQ